VKKPSNATDGVPYFDKLYKEKKAYSQKQGTLNFSIRKNLIN
jgi:hypothetical protein